MRRSLLSLCLLLPLFNACGSDEAAPNGGSHDAGVDALTDGAGGTAGSGGDADAALPDVALEGGGYALTFHPSTGTLDLSRGSTPLAELGADAFQVARVDAISDTFNYDPYPLVAGAAGAREPDGYRWLVGETLTLTSHDATHLVFDVTHAEGKHSALTFEQVADGRFTARLTPASEGDAIAMLRVAPRVSATEAYYGLGEYFDDVNQRGKVRAMQLEIDAQLESSYNEAHVPVPFVIGTQGWGLLVTSSYPGAFDVGKADATRVAATFGTGAASSAGLEFHLLASQAPLDVTRHYYALTGAPRLPARWALGPWVWRDENDDQAQVESDVDTLRSLDLATSAMWIDRPYATGVNTFDFNAPQFPDADAMIAKMHAAGLRVALWHTPYLDSADPATQSLRDEATTGGFYPTKTGLLLNKWGKPIDLTKQAAYDWWQAHIRLYTDRGIEGFKMDYGEDIVPGLLGNRNVWQFSDGTDERTMHRGYTLLYHQVYAETLPASGSFLLCRAGKWGDQQTVSVVWPGDLDASFARHREVVHDGADTYTAVGGLPASVIGGLTLGPSGFPFFGADTGGYRHSPPSAEVFRRWFEQTALSSVMQIGTSTNDVAWEFNDAALLDSYRVYTRLHLRLFPYEWTLAQHVAETGHPIQRPFGLQHPELGVHPSDQYFFGEDLLVAPVLAAGVTARDVVLPPGKWLHWFTGVVYDGGATVSVPAPLGTLPLFVRQGAIVPLLRPTIDTLAPCTACGTLGTPEYVDSYATTPGVLYPRVYPGAASSLTLFDGATLSQEATATGFTLGTSNGAEFQQGSLFEVLAVGSAPAAVAIDGTAAAQAASLAQLETLSDGAYFDPSNGGTLWVRVPAGTHTVTVTR